MIGSSTRKDEALDRLSRGIAQLTSSDDWHAWLHLQARFYQYSFANTVLILCQCPTASRVAGFATWRRLGRPVRSGEHAIWSLAHALPHADRTERGLMELEAESVACVVCDAGGVRRLRGARHPDR
jgi:N-terminal domain of anti-restriction factor ArdC